MTIHTTSLKVDTGADLLARRLSAAGIRRAYGIPGGEVLALVEAFSKAGIQPVLARHENAAGFMAEGAWHASNRPGLLFATLGPGVANAVNVIANARQDRVPLIFVTGCVDEEEAATYTHQVMDHQALLRPIVKATFRATPGTVESIIDQALAIALSGRPGPVHIDLPIGVAEGSAHPLVAGRPILSPRQRSMEKQRGIAKRALSTAKRPLIIAGLDVVNQKASAALTAFARMWSIPVITTYKAKGVFPEADRLAIGAAGLSPKADAILLPLVRQADVVLLVGYDPIEMRLNWRDPCGQEATIVDLVAETVPHGMHHSDVLIEGSVAANLSALGEPTFAHTIWRGGAPDRTKERLNKAFEPRSAWGPDRIFKVVQELVPQDCIVTADSGAHRILLSQMWRVHQPRQLLQSSGFCTMGASIPLALGYKQARPDLPVIAFVGDGGLEMGLGELASARDNALPVVIIVLVDRSLALIEMKQRHAGRTNAVVDIGESDLPAIAQAFGGHGAWISNADELSREVQLALSRQTFSLLACRIPRQAYDGLI